MRVGEGDARTLLRLGTFKLPAMFDLKVTEVVLTTTSIAVAVIVKENNEAPTLTILAVGLNILFKSIRRSTTVQDQHVSFIQSIFLCYSLNLVTVFRHGLAYLGLEYPYHYLQNNSHDIPIPDFKLVHVLRWQQSDILNRQFVVMRATSRVMPRPTSVLSASSVESSGGSIGAEATPNQRFACRFIPRS
ncbi:hypothetical protein FRB95_010163 [Tulasnella sp. JGI-2019a]|nr:hypothetical protein FRB95_010163 [Tulasnella sp. JGI-2019a]